MTSASGMRVLVSGGSEFPGVRSAVKPDAPLTPQDIKGLPLTDKVWDET